MRRRTFRHTFSALSDLSRLMAMENTIDGVVGWKGWDCNALVSRDEAAAFAAMGYSFCMRYIRRTSAASNDLSKEEVQDLHAANISVGPVQHYGPRDGWIPTVALGHQYGTTAALACHELGVPAGVNVWLDLEGIAPGTPSGVIIGYANAWFDAVKAAGLAPAVYLGWQNGLTPSQAYHNLKFTRYWRSLSTNDDEVPVVRGFCLRQHAEKRGDKPDGVLYAIDTDVVMADALGGLPSFWSP